MTPKEQLELFVQHERDNRRRHIADWALREIEKLEMQVKFLQLKNENPFEYAPGEEPPKPQHKPIGVCECCGEMAYTTMDNIRVCWPCAYHLAN